MLDDIKNLIVKGDFDDALIKIEQSNENELDLKILKSIILREKELFNASLTLAEEVLADSRNEGNKIHQLAALTQIAYVLLMKLQEEKLESYLSNFEKIWESLSDVEREYAKEWEGYFYHVKASYHYFQIEYNIAISCEEKCIELVKQLPCKLCLFSAYSNLSVFLQRVGNYTRSLEIAQEMLALSKEQKNQGNVATSYMIIGCNYERIGQYILSREYYIKSIEIAEKLNRRLLASLVEQHMGVNFYLEGDYEQALKNMTSALIVFEDLGLNEYIASVLYHLILVSVKLKSDKLIDSYLNKIELLDKNKQNKHISLMTQLSQATVLKNNPRSKDKIAAQKIFEELLSGHEFVQIAVDATLNLVELLLDELKLYGNEEVLEQIIDLTNNVYETAQHHHLYPIIIDTLILQSKLAFLNQDVDLAHKLLQQGHLIAEEQGLDILTKKVAIEEVHLC
ncbi:MAG: tetratricopeptide repeat protein [Candidatus Kariarchaeaceae archaeon]|jgi:tetratricopeptide (TPR) repeat protein